MDIPLCSYSQVQSVKHIIENCLIIRFMGGIDKVHIVSAVAVDWMWELDIHLWLNGNALNGNIFTKTTRFNTDVCIYFNIFELLDYSLLCSIGLLFIILYIICYLLPLSCAYKNYYFFFYRNSREIKYYFFNWIFAGSPSETLLSRAVISVHSWRSSPLIGNSPLSQLERFKRTLIRVLLKNVDVQNIMSA